MKSPSTVAEGGHSLIMPLARIHPTPASGSSPSTRESTRIIVRKLPPLFFVGTLFAIFGPELVAGAVNEDILERRFAHRDGLNLSREGLDHVGNEAMPAFALDPHLIVAYQFGGNFLAPAPPNGAGMPDKAIQLMEYGIRNNPDDWHLYYELGFIYYLEKKDYASAATAFERGTRVPNAHPFLKVLAAQMAQHAGELQTARMLWVTAYRTTQEKLVRANAVAHLRALQVDEDVIDLQDAVTRYGQKTGHLPPSFAAMVAAGVLPRIPVDPEGHTYKLLPDGRIEVRSPDDFPFIEKGLPPGYKPPHAKLDAK